MPIINGLHARQVHRESVIDIPVFELVAHGVVQASCSFVEQVVVIYIPSFQTVMWRLGKLNNECPIDDFGRCSKSASEGR
jgi:hypothetical protein